MVSKDVLHQHGTTLLHRTSNVMIQSVFYGMYTSLIPVSIYIMMEKGLRSPIKKILFGIIVFMFFLSTAYLAVTMADLILLIKTWYLVADLSESAGTTRSPTEAVLVLFNSLTPINSALTDGVVVWRAWVICHESHDIDELECKKLLAAPIVMLGLTTLGIIATIGVRIFINIDPVNREGRLAHTISVFQEITYISSLVTNILGTGVISLLAWRYRRWIVANLQRIVNKRTKAERVMALIVESGVIYIFTGVVMIGTSLVRLPRSHFVLGNLFLPAAPHLAGIYPLMVGILVSRELSIDKTLLNPTLPTIVTDIQPASSQSSQFRASQPADHPAMSTPMANTQSVTAQGPLFTRGSPDSPLSQNSLASSSSLEPDVDLEVQSDDRGSVE
ncbi:hypothetical protein EDB84DRAFT_1211457 [Lactarius hengduanensis]|nr:hypothetical protein EDB84DRAFT_1211457 [Lactarius hengduanensis]